MSGDDLVATARRFLAARSDVPTLRDLEVGAGHDPATWAEMVDLGWPGLGMRHELGGSGGTLADVAAVAAELGRAAWPGPLLPTWLALEVISACGATHESVLASTLEEGLSLALVAPTEPAARVRFDGSLTGPPSVVEWAHQADRLVVVADVDDDPNHIAVAIVAPPAPGLSIAPARSLDNERVATVSLAATPLAPGTVASVDREVARAALDRVALLRAAVMVGGAEAVLAMTTAHVLDRHQFGRPLAAFQAVRHLAADVATAIDGARLLLADALRTRHRGLVAAAVHVAGRAYVQSVVTGAQLHGGVGVTDEHVLPQHFRRAEAMSLRAGSERSQLEAIADGLVRDRRSCALGPTAGAKTGPDGR